MNKSPKLSAIFIHDADSIFAGLKFQEHLNVLFLVFVIKTNIENFTNNNKLLFCQLSKLLKS
ncbi:hypothetical protein BSR23_002975 [Vibrio parahaemolyticus]|nr:hypothetical protein BSR23_002975 [Vibrio parahaemolyticus]